MASTEPTNTETVVDGADLDPSELGTKSHWDKAYLREKDNFLSNPEDEGIIWFDESGAEDRMINYLSTLDLPAAPSFLDLGTGNGHLLFEIYETGEYDDSAFVGIDYSEAAVDLARKIAKEREVEEEVRFEVADIIGEEMQGKDWVPEGGFDVVLDKGTYDAISLSDEKLADGRRIYEDYPRKVSSVLKRDGWLVITSCNWTEEELRAKMGVQKDLQYYGKISYPTFTFGGHVGQTICSLCFRKI